MNDKKQKRKEQIIAFFIALGIIILGASFLGVGSDIETANEDDAVSATSTESKKEKKQDKANEAEYYKKNVAPNLDKLQETYDNIWSEQWQVTMDAMSKGKVSIYKGYEIMKTIEDNYSKLSSAFSRLSGNNLSKENQKLLEDYKKKMSNASYYRSQAAKKMAKIIDDGNFKPSKLDSVKSYISLADQDMIDAVVDRAAIENNLGLIQKEK